MKTKPFLLATAGSTVDGRKIDDQMLTEMASSYDPKTYGARLNIEHIRGLSGDGPFRAFGDVLELTTGQVDVNFNGKTEKRLGLYGVFDVTDDAKQLNEASQKVYSSIEIEPNFGGKGFAYLMGCALTDSPASIATERLQFNRSLPGTINLSRDESAALELIEDTGAGGSAFLTSFKTMLDGFAAKFTPNKPEPKPEEKPDATPVAFDFAQMRPLFDEFTTSIAQQFISIRAEFREDTDALALKVKKLGEDAENTPQRDFRSRPQGNGNTGNYSGIF